jgi:hypothetical protein
MHGGIVVGTILRDWDWRDWVVGKVMRVVVQVQVDGEMLGVWGD